jgi:hypothetical protein
MPRNSARDASVVALFDNSTEHALLRQNNAGSFMTCSGSQLHHTHDCGDPARPRSTWCASNWRLRRLRRVPPDGLNDRLLDGAHRIACALALRLPEIWQVKDPREARRTWGLDWFAAHGLDADDQDDLLLRFARMRAWFA